MLLVERNARKAKIIIIMNVNFLHVGEHSVKDSLKPRFSPDLQDFPEVFYKALLGV